MSLEDVADYVRADFAQVGCPAEVLFGREYIEERGSPPRVVIVPSETPDKYEMPFATQTSGFLPEAFTLGPLQGINPKPIYRRIVTGSAHIWAAAPPSQNPAYNQRKLDQLALDCLINQTILSIKRACFGCQQILGGKQVQQVNQLNLGFVYVLQFTVEVPIVDVPFFPPGYIDESTRTYPELPVTGFDISVREEEQVTGVELASVQFVADGTDPDDE